MPESHLPSQNSSSQEGLRGRAKAMGGGFSSYAKVRAELLALEAKEAGYHISRKLIFLVLAAFFGIFFYSLLMVGLSSLLAHWLCQAGDGVFAGWIGGVLILAGLHFIAAILFFLQSRKFGQTSLFEFTRSELKKDQEWLRENSSKKN